jgi:hypothetical protein
LQELLDLKHPTEHLPTRDILVRCVVRKDRIEPVRLMKGPSSVKVIHELADLLR